MSKDRKEVGNIKVFEEDGGENFAFEIDVTFKGLTVSWEGDVDSIRKFFTEQRTAKLASPKTTAKKSLKAVPKEKKE